MCLTVILVVGWPLAIAHWKWIVALITIWNICWCLYQIVFMSGNSRMPLQPGSAGYISQGSLNIRHFWWVHLREKLIIWWLLAILLIPIDGCLFWIIFTLIPKIHGWLLLIPITTDHSWNNVWCCGSSHCSSLQWVSRDGGRFVTL